jgi:flagellar biosynthesis/type III secretory pathway M-ring protein FliF/YscJ
VAASFKSAALVSASTSPWDARITLSSGLLERSARATITFPAAGAAPSVITSSTRPGWLYLAIAGLVVLLLVILGLLAVLRRRWRRPPRDDLMQDEENDDPTDDSDGHDQTVPWEASAHDIPKLRDGSGRDGATKRVVS